MARFLYVGRFELPDKEATANRVVANAKLLRELGHEVILAGWSEDVGVFDGWKSIECYGFESYQKHKAKSSFEKYKMFVDASPELELMKSIHPDVLVAYDFPAVALDKLMKFCRKNGIKCICDVSEWYTNANKNPLFRLVRAYDSYKRMKVLHKRADGLIVISKYLQEYYCEQNTVLIPPLIDIEDPKWEVVPREESDTCKFVYVGWPSRTKERLDLVVAAVSSLAESNDVSLDIYGITEKQYREIYKIQSDAKISECVGFHGRVPHLEAISAVKNADYSLVIREACLKNNAGFPSKLVECIGCGTAVITTPISNVSDYVGDGKNGFVITIDKLLCGLERAISRKTSLEIDKETFDYRNFSNSLEKFLKGLNIT